VNDDIGLLELIASGIIQGYDNSRLAGYLEFPYPSDLQRSLNRLAAKGIVAGHPYPHGLAELLEWARRRPISEWFMELDDLEIAPEARLLVGSTPTALCLELAHESKDAEMSIAYERFAKDLFSACRATGDESTYVSLRRHLIERPALPALHLQMSASSLPTHDLRSVLLSAYTSAGADTAFEDGSRATCSHCGALLARVDGHGRCVGSLCKRFLEASVGQRFSSDQNMVELRPSIRRFVHDPGLAELRLARSLERAGCAVQMWPDFDVYDIRASWANLVWAVEVKAWLSPRLLAVNLEPLPPTPVWDSAFVVVPDTIARRNSGYIQVVRRLLGESAITGFNVLAERDLVRLARNQSVPHSRKRTAAN
jgi:hypothetical protein